MLAQGEEFNSWLSSTPYTGPVGVIVKLYVKQVAKGEQCWPPCKARLTLFDSLYLNGGCIYVFILPGAAGAIFARDAGEDGQHQV